MHEMLIFYRVCKHKFSFAINTLFLPMSIDIDRPCVESLMVFPEKDSDEIPGRAHTGMISLNEQEKSAFASGKA